MDDVACKTWVTLPVSTLQSSVRDGVSDTFCMINNEMHAGSPECACYWSNTGNDESWKNTLGKKNYDAEKDPSHVVLPTTLVDWSRLYRDCGLRRTEEYHQSDLVQLQVREENIFQKCLAEQFARCS